MRDEQQSQPQNIFAASERSPVPVSYHLRALPLPSHERPLICFLSLEISPSWTPVWVGSWGLMWLASLTSHNAFKGHVPHNICTCIPFCGRILFHSGDRPHFVYPLILIDIWVVSAFWRLWIMLLWAFVCMFYMGMFPFLLGICLGFIMLFIT